MSMDTMFGSEKETVKPEALPKIDINPEVDKALDEVRLEVSPWEEKAKNLTIESDDQFQAGMDMVAKLKMVQKGAEAKLAWALEPVKESEKRTRSLFSPLLDILKRVKPIIEGKLGCYQTFKEAEEAKRRKAENDRIQKQMESGKPVTVKPAPAPQPKAVETPHGTGSMTKIWYAEIVNPDEVERLYCSPDQSKLDKLAKAMKDPKAAPKGVMFKFRPGTRVR